MIGATFLVLCMFYPLWGTALLVLLGVVAAKRLRARLGAAGAALAAAAGCTAIFTPVVIGAEGFMVLAPWWASFPLEWTNVIVWRHVRFYWPLAAVAFFISLLAGALAPRYKLTS